MQLPPATADSPERTPAVQAVGRNLDFTMAFQPIVDVEHGEILAYEALIRGRDGGPATSLLRRVTRHNRYRFDQYCRVRAIRMAAALGLTTRLALNFLPNAVRRLETCVADTIRAAHRTGISQQQLIFEFTEKERIRQPELLRELRETYRDCGFIMAIDDFGAGYAGLQLLADFQPDLIKLDHGLMHGLAANPARQAIVRAVLAMATDLNCRVVAEGVESAHDFDALRNLGIGLFQGFLFAAPTIEQLPPVALERWRA